MFRKEQVQRFFSSSKNTSYFTPFIAIFIVIQPYFQNLQHPFYSRTKIRRK